MKLTAEFIATVAQSKVSDNIKSVVSGLELLGVQAGLDLPQNLVPYLAQLAHESSAFRYDREIWGPTAAQKGYEGRKDLGNTVAGDGYKYRGRGPLQITGRFNTTMFWEWCKKIDPNCPNFVESPDLINTDPWEGLGPIWYWETRDLNRYTGDMEMLTRKINGGLNGYSDRLGWFTKFGLAFLGYDPISGAKPFQRETGLTVDGIAGVKTRSKIAEMLKDMDPVIFGERDMNTEEDQVDKLLTLLLPRLKELLKELM